MRKFCQEFEGAFILLHIFQPDYCGNFAHCSEIAVLFPWVKKCVGKRKVLKWLDGGKRF